MSDWVELIDLLDNNIISKDFYHWLISEGFTTAPASAGHHGNWKGGLYAHSQHMTYHLLAFDAVAGHPWKNPRSPYIVGMFHDLCKIDQYEYKPKDEHNDCHWSYSNRAILKGHGDKSVMLLSQFMTLTEEEVLCIRYHMGAYEQADWESFDKAIRKYPNVLYTHTADMLASKLDV